MSAPTPDQLDEAVLRSTPEDETLEATPDQLDAALRSIEREHGEEWLEAVASAETPVVDPIIPGLRVKPADLGPGVVLRAQVGGLVEILLDTGNVVRERPCDIEARPDLVASAETRVVDPPRPGDHLAAKVERMTELLDKIDRYPGEERFRAMYAEANTIGGATTVIDLDDAVLGQVKESPRMTTHADVALTESLDREISSRADSHRVMGVHMARAERVLVGGVVAGICGGVLVGLALGAWLL